MDKAVSAPELLGLLRGRERGSRTGVWSCCSANEYVIRAALRRGLARSAPVLVEATANQVDQNGGYTGMRPEVSGTSSLPCLTGRVSQGSGSSLAGTIWDL